MAEVRLFRRHAAARKKHRDLHWRSWDGWHYLVSEVTNKIVARIWVTPDGNCSWRLVDGTDGGLVKARDSGRCLQPAKVACEQSYLEREKAKEALRGNGS